MSLKCVLLGNTGSGKSSIILQYLYKKFNVKECPTIGAAFNYKTIKTNNGFIKVELWDTAGQERFDSLAPLYYRNADIAMIVYDITSLESYDKAKKWIDLLLSLAKPPLCVLIGNKYDISEYRKIRAFEAANYANDKDILYFECSAKTGYNINYIFERSFNTAFKEAFKIKGETLEEPAVVRYKCCY